MIIHKLPAFFRKQRKIRNFIKSEEFGRNTYMKPKVTVLTCVYNGLPYLKDSIDSILSQTYSDFEYLIIDDASPDENVIKLIESYNDSRQN